MMDGEVDMHYRENGEEHIVQLKSGDIFYAGIGTEHVAHPCGEARIFGDRERRQCLRSSEKSRNMELMLNSVVRKLHHICHGG